VQHDVSDVHPVEYLRGQTDGGRKVLLEEKLSNTTTSILTPEYSVNNKCLHDVPDQETVINHDCLSLADDQVSEAPICGERRVANSSVYMSLDTSH
ncbi:hypothetical protein KUCAC02_017061, partial [Chaenocephalus aceratus]